MTRNLGLAICLSYCIGLLSTGFFGLYNPHPSWQQWLIVTFGLFFLYFVVCNIIKRLNYGKFNQYFWFSSVIVALLGVIYLQIRIPQPSLTDISHLISTNAKTQIITITGKALSESRQTTNQKIQFWLAPQEVTSSHLINQSVSGKLYVTLGLSEKLVIHTNQVITIQGLLYLPKSSSNPNSFDFKAYLHRQGAFAGLKGLKLIELQEPPWGLWLIRQRIVNALQKGLGESYGSILGSIVIGRQAVDLPIEVREAFIKAGLAHVFAASGFQVALLLGIVIRLTRALTPRKQLMIGIFVLVFYVGLTGLQPSILRASLMGAGALIGMILNRKTYPLGSLLLAGTILLLFNPLWIWDLGFQLSFLATFGLIVTLPILLRWFDWLPPTIATIITLPLAASIWTFPLLIYTFSSVVTYGVLVNIITAPLITIISFGGMFSAAMSLIYPALGSAIAFLFYYLIHFLLQTVLFFNHLPASAYAIGKLPLSLMLFIYLIMILVWLNSWFRRYWILICLFLLTITIITVSYSRLSLEQITVLSSSSEPIIIIQNRGQVIVINGEEAEAVKYTLIPFLTQQGINQIDYVISVNSDANWSIMSKSILLKNKINVSQNNSFNLDNLKLSFPTPNLFQLQFKDQTWLWIKSNAISQKMLKQNLKLYPEVLLWSSKTLNKNWLNIIQPKVAIFFNYYPSQTIKNLLTNQQIQFFSTGKDSTTQWNTKQGFQTYVPETN
ncbi:ComEC/Rec2 family competence protein [Chroococcus sp. FPU101]|uniref:ComEC/Rec2 family competence protein n=1 Tax=Chroococcus sp. FPU101 TaxID=1974212 RepID=UPI001A8FC6CD|nr:ComEC/Rec2 family competence protein [Chroococcus sp. FPU101]GFE70126.1 ComEC/Rec2-related protein [Chroococcus sp. FPU101]